MRTDEIKGIRQGIAYLRVKYGKQEGFYHNGLTKVCFEPDFASINSLKSGESDNIRALSDFLQERASSLGQGIMFYPKAKFWVYENEFCLTLVLQPDRRFSSAEAIDVIDKKKADLSKIEEHISKISGTSAFGIFYKRLHYREERGDYIILARDYSGTQ